MAVDWVLAPDVVFVIAIIRNIALAVGNHIAVYENRTSYMIAHSRFEFREEEHPW